MGAEIRNNAVKADLAVHIGDVGWNGGGVFKVENNQCIARVGAFACVNPVGNQIELYNPNFNPELPPGPDNPPMVSYMHPGMALSITGNAVNMDATDSIDLIHGMTAGIFAQDVFFLGYPTNNIKNATVQNNVFTGIADFGVFMGNLWDVPDSASGNSFVYNDFNSLNSGIASVYLGLQTSNNVFGPNNYPPGGAYHEVYNEGTKNRVVGLPAKTMADPGIGQVVRDVISRSNAAKQQYGGMGATAKGWAFLPPQVRARYGRR
jgi:hypothetical protein